MRSWRLGLQLLATAACLPSVAASLHEAALIGQVQQQFSGSEIAACGVTVSAMETKAGAPAGSVLVFNGSVMVYDLHGGLVKGRAATIDAKLVASGKANFSHVKVMPTITVWMKAPEAPVTAPRPGTTVADSEDKGYRIYPSDFNSTWGVIDAIVDGKAIQIGMKVRGANTDQVLFGIVQLSEAEHGQLVGCLQEWSKAIKKKFNIDESTNQPTKKE